MLLCSRNPDADEFLCCQSHDRSANVSAMHPLAFALPSAFRILLCSVVSACAAALHAADKKVLLIAGPPSHGPGQHEHNAGVLLLQKCLANVSGLKTEIALGGWPKIDGALNGVDAIIIFADGGPRHIALKDDRL